ncbi:hypothetical protein B0O99DRAFT_156791 [Bisporella sp. PMI_857]|nr:hypothetical protein B0O99DRAFT_156791 [Bisporella sp. PMI_857]
MRYCRFKRQIDAKVPKPQNTNSTTPQTQFIASTEDTHITALSGSNESMKLESSCSEHDTNWDEESGSENQVHQYSISRGDLSGDYTNNLVIPPAEVKVADAPMEEVLFKQDWVSTLRKCTPGSTLPTANTADPASQQASSSHGAKRRRESDVQGNPEEGDEGDESDSSHKLKRARTSKESMNIIKFACPYRKHDPRRYSVLKWAPCALTPHKTVARVKCDLSTFGHNVSLLIMLGAIYTDII